MDHQNNQFISQEQDKQFQRELAAALGVSTLEEFPDQLIVTKEQIPDMTRWLE